jgi:hypothetical protein
MSHAVMPTRAMRRPGPQAWIAWGHRSLFLRLALLLASALPVSPRLSAQGQEAASGMEWFPERSRLPILPSGSREPVSKASLLHVFDNPNSFGSGLEVEVAVGAGLAVAAWGDTAGSHWVLGVQAGVYARFGYQQTTRELINSDWTITAPLFWRHERGWIRFQYFHTSSHLGDEYIRVFEETGKHFARDAVEILALREAAPWLDLYAGGGFGYNVHPSGSGRWWTRAGFVVQPDPGAGGWAPMGSLDVDLDQEAGWTPRWTAQAGVWLPPLRGRRWARITAELVTGPTPLGQFFPGRTTYGGIGIVLHL